MTVACGMESLGFIFIYLNSYKQLKWTFYMLAKESSVVSICMMSLPVTLSKVRACVFMVCDKYLLVDCWTWACLELVWC